MDAVKYEMFRREQERENYLYQLEAEKKGNREYNRGLLEGLGFFNLWLYPLLARRNV